MREKFRPPIQPELFIPENWYYNDEFVSDVYYKISKKELSETTIQHLYNDVQAVLNEILSRDENSRSSEEHEKAIALNNIARELFAHFPHPLREPASKPNNDVQDLTNNDYPN